MDSLLAPRYLQWLLEGFAVTLALSAVVSVVALALGLVYCVLRLSPLRAIAGTTALWLSLFRNTPLLVQLFFWYFGAAALLPSEWRQWLNSAHHWELGSWGPGLWWPSFEVLAGFVGLTLYSAAFMAEEFRAGVRGVPAGQVVAARALGLRPLQVWRHVVLPQAVRIALPPLLGQVMNVIKNSSLTMAIGLAELSYAARQVETETFRTFQAFGIATLLYIAAIAVLEVAGQALHRRSRLPHLPHGGTR